MFQSFIFGALFGFFVLPIVQLWNFRLSFPMACLAFLLNILNDALFYGKSAYDAPTFIWRRNLTQKVMRFLESFLHKNKKFIRKVYQTKARDGSIIEFEMIRSASDVDATLPLLYFVHGGGWVSDYELLYVPAYHDIIERTHCAVCYVHYRLAPEVKFPVPINDSDDVLRYVLDHAEEYKINPELTYLIGDSAGGHICADMMFRFAKENYKYKIRQNFAIYPAADTRQMSKSDATKGLYYGLTNYHMGCFVSYFYHSIDEFCSPEGSPCIYDPELTCEMYVPPTYIFVDEHDICRDGGIEYKEKLLKLNKEVHFEEFKGAVHACWLIPSMQQHINSIVENAMLNILLLL
ncbi:hypothetical protein WA158_001388 [Blastocystis sp. Blastoise]